MMCLALIAGAQIVSLAAGAESPDASGKWTADLAKCDFGMEAVPTSLVYGVEQKGVTLRVERIRQEDGKETKTARTFEARWDGAALILEYHANYQGYDLDVTEKKGLNGSAFGFRRRRRNRTEAGIPQGVVGMKTAADRRTE